MLCQLPRTDQGVMSTAIHPKSLKTGTKPIALAVAKTTLIRIQSETCYESGFQGIQPTRDDYHKGTIVLAV